MRLQGARALPRGQGGEEPHCGSPEGEALWEKCGDSNKNQASPSIAPNKPNSKNAGLPKNRRTLQSRPTYQMRRPNQPRISNTAVLLMSAKPAKSEAILRRSAVRTQTRATALAKPHTQHDYHIQITALYGSLPVLRFFCRSFKGVRP